MKRIIVVEDDDFIRELLLFFLKQKDFDVKEARNGLETLALIESYGGT